MSKRKMDSRELGLVLGQQLLGVDDLHYGLWEDDIERKLANLPIAQQRYTEMLAATLPAVAEGVRLLDVGCGTGHILEQLLERGYSVDAVSPAPELSRQVGERLERFPDNDTRLFQCRFEDLPVEEVAGQYDAIFFSESFQYIDTETALTHAQQLLKSGGSITICDFFKTDKSGDGGPADQIIGGGHRLERFYLQVEAAPFEAERDEDITSLVSPNMDVLNDFLMNTIKPAGLTLGEYLQGRYPKTGWLAKRLMGKKFAKLGRKYFSGKRTGETFERYKNYRLLVLRLQSS